MAHIPYYGEEENSAATHISYFGPWSNRYGYTMTFAVIDDLFVLKTVTPDSTKRITYHWSEDSLEHRIELNNQDRIY